MEQKTFKEFLRSPPLSPPDFHLPNVGEGVAIQAYDRLHFHPPIFTSDNFDRIADQLVLTIASTFTPRFSPSLFDNAVVILDDLRSPPLSPPDFHGHYFWAWRLNGPPYDRLHFHPPIFTIDSETAGVPDAAYDRLHFHPPIFTAGVDGVESVEDSLRSPPLSPPDFHQIQGALL